MLLRDLPENVTFAKPWNQYTLIKAADAKETQGKRYLNGPFSPPETEKDYDNDGLTKGAIESGIPMFLKLGGGQSGHIDWGHMYVPSGKNPKYLIAKGMPFKGPDGRPWLQDELFAGKEFADAAWEHVTGGGHAGHSIDGICKARDPLNKAIIVQTEIHRVTIDPSPKGFSNFLKVGPAESLTEIVKGILYDSGRSGLADSGWVPMPINMEPEYMPAYFSDPQLAEKIMKAICHVPRFYAVGMAPEHINKASNGEDQTRCPECDAKNRITRSACRSCGAKMGLNKALSTGASVVGSGATGGPALRKQAMLSGVSKTSGGGLTACDGCGCKNRKSREVCKRCGDMLPVRKALGLVGALQELGADDPAALARVLR